MTSRNGEPVPLSPGASTGVDPVSYPVIPGLADFHGADPEVTLDVGWGRLIFGNTFGSVSRLVDVLRQEADDERDIAIYVDDPHVALAKAPQHIFLDPSHTYRLDLGGMPLRAKAEASLPRGVTIRQAKSRDDTTDINRIYAHHKMVLLPADFIQRHQESARLVWLAAVDEHTGQILGSVMGVDHVTAFNDPSGGSSLWGLAVDPQAHYPAIGRALVLSLAYALQDRGRFHLDLSVMHDNTAAIALYEKLGFQRIQTFTLKCKNPVNEPLYAARRPAARLNPYAQIIINEACRRGIAVEIEDEDANLFTLSHGGRRVTCRESLSDLTSAVALQRCDDKSLTRRLLHRAGLRVPRQRQAGDIDRDRAFMEDCGRVVVKPARGEQGAGITVDLSDPEDLAKAIEKAEQICDRVLIEEFCEGQDLRVIVIGRAVVAAAIRRPAGVIGDGKRSVRELIELQSRRRKAVTGGESAIPLDAETERCVLSNGASMDMVLPEGEELFVRKTANLHTGGTIHDVTGQIHEDLRSAAVQAAAVLDIPVVGLDFLVPDIAKPDYVIIEANERPGLANHEPQPTAARFVDLLFPQTLLGNGSHGGPGGGAQ